jgi:hypothetical protein
VNDKSLFRRYQSFMYLHKVLRGCFQGSSPLIS